MALSGAAGFVSRPHAASDSRLLTNLIKTERTYIQHLHASVSSGHAASAALSAWGTSEAPDISDASARLGSLLAACADVQSTHVAAIEGYRAALKDVADREASIRSVVRDRDILVGRLIKASNKAASSSHSKSPEERAEKVAVARRELHACEEVLASEEAALVGVKRRTFKEALTMRMKTMGDAGAAMVDAAKEAILLLDSFDSTARQHYPHPYDAEDGYQQYQDQDQDQEGQHHQYDLEQPSEDSHATWRQMQSMQQHQHQQQQQQHVHAHGHEADSDDRLPVNHPAFENSSVTPSQSASQVNQQQYSRPLGGMHAPYPSRIGEEASQRHRGRGNDDEDDDDSDSDWDEGHQRGTGTPIPPPHQIGRDMATFVPEQPQAQPQQSRERNNRPDMHTQLPPNDPTHNVTPGPTPPAKEERPLSRTTPTSKQAKAARAPARDVNVVPMPEVPMAPRLNLDGVNLGPVPLAPKLYMPGASSGNQDESDSSADEANGRGTVAHRGGGGGGGGSFRMRPSVAHAAAGGHSFDSSASGTARQDRDGARARKGSGSGGFFGRMGKLFKTDIKGEPATAAAAAAEGDGRSRKTSSSAWETRTDANLRGVRQSNQADDGVERARRRQNLLRGPIGSVEQDSSDEEDQRDLVRHVNQPRPLWQTDQTNSDVGIGSRLTGIGKRASLRRIPSSASVTAGPKSWKAKQEEEEQARRAVIGTGFAGSATAAAPAPGAPEAGSLKKKGTVTKKKKKQPTPSQDGGSEIGTQATRTRSTAASVKPKRSSVIVPGDASAGVRRSESLNYGSKGRASGAAAGDKVARRTSKRMSAVAPGDLEAKFNTSSWVTKSTDYMPEEAPVRAAAAAAAVAAPPAAKAPNAAPTSHPAQAQPPQPQQQREGKDSHPRHVPQPSAATSPPLKPALKVPGGAADLMRTGSISSSIGGGRSSPMPVLPPPISAPPPVTSLSINQLASAPAPARAPAHASLGVDSTIDGTGHLDVELGKSDSNKPATPSQLKRSSVPVPRIDMPASEPFKLDLDERGKPTTPSRRTPLAEAGRVSPALMTPGEASAYQQFLTNNPGPAEAPSAMTTNTDGVRRFVDRSTKLGSGVGSPPRPAPAAAAQTLSTPTKTSRTYGAGLGDDSSDSDDGGAAATTAAPTAAASAAPAAQASTGAATANPATSNLSAAPANVATSDTSVDAGSGVSRRKSVRMAPDVKLPPETPTEDHSFDSAFNNNSKKSSSSHQRHSSTDQPGATLSARIAPPPPAPPRIHQSKDYSPVDLGATPRERQGWATRIGRSTADDSDSSDDEGRGGAGEQGADSYASARQAFNMASRSWGKATGSSKQASTTKKGAGTESVASTTGSIKKKKSISKKKSASNNNVSGYNPAIPLPAGMEVVGRSGSIRR